MSMNDCPCKRCKYYVYGKNHGNCIDLHYCEKLHKSIIEHHGNSFHSAGTWLIPCGRDMNFFKPIKG